MARPPQTAPRGSRLNLVILGLVILLVIAIIAFPTVMVLGLGMMPTLVAFVIDRTEEKFATFCVGGLNFCGVFPYVMDLWIGDHSISQATGIITDVFKLAMMYGAAAFGWALFMSVPPVITSFLQVLAQRRLATLRGAQRKLVEEWGEDVAESGELPPPDETAARDAA